jgi:hypothetical protein
MKPSNLHTIIINHLATVSLDGQRSVPWTI